MKENIKKFIDKIKYIRKADLLTKSVQNLQYDPDVVIDKVEFSGEFRLSQNRTEIKKIMELVKSYEVLTICEIGTYKGGSLFCLTQAAASNATIISIDIDYPFERRMAFRKFAKNNQRIITTKGDTRDPNTYEKTRRILKGRKIDFLFIDGDHSFNGVVNDYVRYAPLVKKGGIIAFHDIHPVSAQMENSKAYVGDVPIFWDTLKRVGFLIEEVIEDPKQQGKGLGILYL